MYTKSIIRTLCSLAAFAGLFISCKDTSEDLGAPSVEINPSELSFDKGCDTKTITVTATRDWAATTDAEWISVQPKSGKASKDPVTVEIAVLENTGLDREGSVTFDINLDSKSLTVNQKGSGSAADRIVYSNNFDKEKATKSYGTSSQSWPYLDQFEGWKNAEGTGVGSETYAFDAISVRSNSTSNSTYSDYEGSGDNNLFFGTNAYFSVSGVKLPAQTNYAISFGTEKYLNDGDSKFNHSEFHVYVSNDNKKWVELEYTFPSGDKEGRWDLATANFTLPSGTSTLSIYIKADVASAYRLDDLSLNISSESGTAIDFSKGVEIKTDEESGSDDDYTKAEQKTVAEFIAAANTSKYYRLKGKVSNFNSEYCSFDLTDDTGSILVYSVDNKSDWSSKIKNEGTVELAGKYKKYNTTDEVVNAYIISFEEGAEVPATEMSIAEVLASEEGVKAQVSGTVAGTYKRGFIITDGKDYLLVYDGTKCDAKVKDNVTVIGTTDVYGGLTQLASPTVTVVSSGNDLNLPEPKSLAGSDFDSYSSSKVEYITYEGTLSVSGTYYNVAVDGASVHTGSLTYVDDSFNASSYDKAAVKVTGFFVGISGSDSQYVNTMVTDLKPSASAYFNVSAEAVTAKADETSATFTIKSNVDWTVTSDNDAYTVEPASGENDGTVTVKFAANETENDVKVNLTVSTTAEVATKSYTVVLTHKGKSTSTDGSEITLEISGNSSWTEATDDTYGVGYEYTKGDVKYAYYKYKSTSNAVAPKEDHIRVYKSSVLSIVPPTGKKITKVVLNCTKADNCTDMTVLTDNDSTATANAEDLTITWTGEVDSFVAQAVKSQERIKTITITLK
jgi:hypothetical protein